MTGSYKEDSHHLTEVFVLRLQWKKTLLRPSPGAGMQSPEEVCTSVFANSLYNLSTSRIRISHLCTLACIILLHHSSTPSELLLSQALLLVPPSFPPSCIAFDSGFCVDGVPGLIMWTCCTIFLLIQILDSLLLIPGCTFWGTNSRHTNQTAVARGGYTGRPRLLWWASDLCETLKTNCKKLQEEICFKNCSLQPMGLFLVY